MDNEMSARRAEHLTPAGREILDEIQEAMNANNHAGIPAIVERISELPPADQNEIAELLGLLRYGSEAELSRLNADVTTAEGAKRVLLAAREKLQAEGKPVDPSMTVGEAYEVLRG